MIIHFQASEDCHQRVQSQAGQLLGRHLHSSGRTRLHQDISLLHIEEKRQGVYLSQIIILYHITRDFTVLLVFDQ